MLWTEGSLENVPTNTLVINRLRNEASGDPEQTKKIHDSKETEIEL